MWYIAEGEQYILSLYFAEADNVRLNNGIVRYAIPKGFSVVNMYEGTGDARLATGPVKGSGANWQVLRSEPQELIFSWEANAEAKLAELKIQVNGTFTKSATFDFGADIARNIKIEKEEEKEPENSEDNSIASETENDDTAEEDNTEDSFAQDVEQSSGVDTENTDGDDKNADEPNGTDSEENSENNTSGAVATVIVVNRETDDEVPDDESIADGTKTDESVSDEDGNLEENEDSIDTDNPSEKGEDKDSQESVEDGEENENGTGEDEASGDLDDTDEENEIDSDSEEDAQLEEETDTEEGEDEESESEENEESEEETIPEMPAMKLEATQGSVRFIAEVAEDVLPAGAQLVVTPYSLTDAARKVLVQVGYEDMVDQVDENEDYSALIAAYQVAFLNAEGEPVEPEDTVYFKIEGLEISKTALEGNGYALWQIEDDRAYDWVLEDEGENSIEFELGGAVTLAVTGAQGSNGGSTRPGGPRRAPSTSSQTGKEKVGVSWFDNYEADTASYIKVENLVPASNGKASEGGTHTGKVIGAIPAKEIFDWATGHMTDTIAGVQLQNFYPHGDGNNQIGGVLFSVTFPQVVNYDFDHIKVDKGSKAFRTVDTKKGEYVIKSETTTEPGCLGTTTTTTYSKSYDTSKNAVTFLFNFIDMNFAGIIGPTDAGTGYKANPEAIISFEIPFTMNIAEGADLSNLGKVTAKGQTWMHITSSLQPAYIYTNVFTDDVAQAAYQATYKFEYTGDYYEEIPEAVTSQLPEDGLIGSGIFTPPVVHNVNDEESGMWTFLGWDPASSQDSSVDFVGTWDHGIPAYRAVYQFVNGMDENAPVSAGLNDFLPKDVTVIEGEEGEEAEIRVNKYDTVEALKAVNPLKIAGEGLKQDEDTQIISWNEDETGSIYWQTKGFVDDPVVDNENLTVTYTAKWYPIDLTKGNWRVNDTPAKPFEGEELTKTDTSSYWTQFTTALTTMTAADTMYINGELPDGQRFTVPRGNLVVESDVTMKATTYVGNPAVTLSGGAVMTTKPDATFTASNYRYGVYVNANSALSDGNYDLNGNEHGFYLNGTGAIRGLTPESRNTFRITLNRSDSKLPFVMSGYTSVIENVTLEASASGMSKQGATVSATDASGTFKVNPALLIKNADVSLKNMFFQMYGWDIIDSHFVMDGSAGSGGILGRGGDVLLNFYYGYKRTTTWQNSQIEFKNAKYNIVTTSERNLNIVNSTVTVTGGSPTVLFNIRREDSDAEYAFVNVTNSTIDTRGTTFSGIVAGSGRYPGAGSGISFGADTVLNTNSGSYQGNIVSAPTSNRFGYVTGGSHMIYYQASRSVSLDSTSVTNRTPTSGYGKTDDYLSYFKLADPGLKVLTVEYEDGVVRDYHVARASSDGNKYVWTPASAVYVHAVDVDNTITGAKFGSGSMVTSAYNTIRGMKINDVVRHNATSDNRAAFKASDIEGLNAPGKIVVGWVYKVDQKGDAMTLIETGEEEISTDAAFAAITALATSGARVDIYPVWADAPQTIKYSFVSDSEGDTLPEQIKVYLESEDLVKTGVKGDLITLPTYDDVVIDDEGTWVFKGWTLGDDEEYIETVTVADADIMLFGHWDYEPDKDAFDITFVDEDGTVLLELTENNGKAVDKGATPEYTDETPTKAATAQYTYTFSGWTPEIVPAKKDATYTATYEATINKYTIKFVNGDGTELQSDEVEYGETPEYSGETPSKDETVDTVYTFAGWDKEIASVTGDATYTAKYTESIRKYTITFVDEDGKSVLQSGKVAYDQTPAYIGETPTKAATAQYSYTFSGWTPALAIVTGDATYTAVYTETVRTYTITWLDGDGKTLDTDEVEYGEVPSYNIENAKPTKTATDTTVYTFNNTWSPEITAVTGEATYTAQFDEAERQYSVTWLDEDGETVIETRQVNHAAFIDEDLADAITSKPEKAEDVAATYEFEKFELTGNVVGVSKTFTAVYSATPKQYAVSYEFTNGTTSGSKVGTDLPDVVTDLLPEMQKLNYGSEVTATMPIPQSVQDEEGNGAWVFQGFEPEGTQTLDEKGIAFSGAWIYTAEPVEVTYVFTSASEDWKTLPEVVTSLLPGSATAGKGVNYVLKQPDSGSIDETLTDASGDEQVVGTWTFDGYKTEDDNTITEIRPESNTTVTGYWSFTPAEFDVTYTFQPADEKWKKYWALDEETVSSKLPATVKAAYGSEVIAADLTDESVTGAYGTWTFTDWAQGTATVTVNGATFAGSWTFKIDQHEVSYAFVSENGDPLPEEFTSVQLPQALLVKDFGEEEFKQTTSTSLDDGTTVKVSEEGFNTRRVDTDEGTWLFNDDSWKYADRADADSTAYQDIPEDGVEINDRDVVFIGTWRFISNGSKTVDIKLHANNGTNETESALLIPDSEKEADRRLPANTFTYAGNVFIGWSAEPLPVLTGLNGADYLYRDTDFFRFDNPGIKLSITEPAAQGVFLRNVLGWVAYADEEPRLYGDLYAVWAKEDDVTATVDLPADLLVNNDTEHDKTYVVKTGDTVTVTAALAVQTVINQINNIYDQYNSEFRTTADTLQMNEIILENVQSEFIAKVHPTGVDLSEARIALSFLKDDDSFNDTEAQFVAKGLTADPAKEGDYIVNMPLENADKIDNFEKLYNLIGRRMKDTLSLDVSNAKITQSGGYARVSGTVSGTMSAKATFVSRDGEGNIIKYRTICFSFVWNGVQEAEKSDAVNPNYISVTMEVVPEVELPGDLSVSETGKNKWDTEHDAIYVTKPGAVLDYKASLDVTAVKEQMTAIEGNYDRADGQWGDIEFPGGIECSFHVTLYAQPGLTLPTASSAYALDATNFTITNVAVSDRAEIDIVYNGGAITNYALLHSDIIEGTEDVLNLVVTGVKVADGGLGFVAGAPKMIGYVNGSFKATAKLNGQEIPFNFLWMGTQQKTPDGSDFVLGDNEEGIIQLTVQAQPEVELPGDLLVAASGKTDYDTEHEEIFATTENAELDYLANLKVGTVFEQMTGLIGQYGELKPELRDELAQIAIVEKAGKRITSSFTAVFTAQTGLNLADINTDDVELINPGNFKITSAKVVNNGRNDVLTVVMTYDAGDIDNFLTLYDNIGDMAKNGDVKLLIPGVKAEIPAGTLYLKGVVSGTFDAVARYNDVEIPFSFIWKGTQDKDPDGSDVVLGANDSGDIQLTVQVLPTVDLPGDIQVKDGSDTTYTTEHDEVFHTEDNATLDFAATLNVSSIKELITTIGDHYEDRGATAQDQIALSNINSYFDVVITTDAGLDMTNASFALPNRGRFDPKVMRQAANEVVIRFTYNADGIDYFNKLEADITGMDDLLVMNIDGVKVNNILGSSPIPVSKTMRGTITGLFHGDAAFDGREMPFDFAWNGVQDREMQVAAPESNAGISVGNDGQDAVLKNAEVPNIQATIVVVPELKLPGDIQVKTPAKGDNYTTEHEAVYITETGAKLTYAALLDVSGIKDQLEAVTRSYTDREEELANEMAQIALNGVKSEFHVKVTAEQGLDISSATFMLVNAVSKGSGSPSFRIKGNPVVSGQTATLDIEYVTSPDNFKILYDDISNMPGMLMLTMENVAVEAGVDEFGGIKLARDLTMTGEITGDFYALATYNERTLPFAFDWKGVQDHALTAEGAEGVEREKNGADALLPDNTDTIQLTVVVAPEVELPGDLQVKTPAKGDAFTTEHDKVYITESGAKLTYAATLNVGAIKNQLVGEQDKYHSIDDSVNNDTLANIKLDKLRSQFIVTLTADEGLTLPTTGTAYTLVNGRNFSITDVKKEGQKVTITMDYHGKPATFKDLKDDIYFGMDDILEMDIVGVQVDEMNDILSKNLTLKGEVSGDFYSLATMNTTTLPFSFTVMK